jgi:predicted DsbA family dithiol-disulfide isomerase
MASQMPITDTRATRHRIAVVSDVICPWCFIGKRRFDEALREAGVEGEIEVTWLPFELNPEMPEGGMDRDAYLDAKFGPGKRAEIEARLSQAAAENGVAFNWAGVTRTPNTRRAHMLIAIATSEGKGSAAAEALFRGYFLEGRDIGDIGALMDIGESIGLPRDLVQAAVTDERLDRLIAESAAQAAANGVTGVPFFVIDDTWAVSGAQPTGVWREALSRLFREGTPTGVA